MDYNYPKGSNSAKILDLLEVNRPEIIALLKSQDRLYDVINKATVYFLNIDTKNRKSISDKMGSIPKGIDAVDVYSRNINASANRMLNGEIMKWIKSDIISSLQVL